MADFILVTVAATRGSAPRDTDAFMRVWPDRQEGTIGGGTLEWEAARIAREVLAAGEQTAQRTLPLGPDLGQCCGGVVTLEFKRNGTVDTLIFPPLWIWGGGHVGRAIARVMAPFEDRDITVIDTTAERMPDLPEGVAPLVAADPVRVVAHAPANADHLILTYSHDLDLALCDALLRHGFASAGLIGSATKKARFRSRLSAMGHTPEAIARIACPIGDPALGKHPQAIAIGVAAALRCGPSTHASNEPARDRTG
ncbi:xanthine dehydrogenase accessory protein XdhC [Thalassorhabdomicrobium marinisediminis]|uniref:xanthine dehydrogenase accessory protein XdhC n=1 Tax=Thalassorhabdomicrobium marinisediminis TaxID=2170577 RepID=UPI0024900A23|nr:xanthine dehydrogenase accessory protein XdhC [Thalassorhabdomicrobium marinisediminis]